MNIFSHHKCATRWLVAYLARTAQLNGLSFFHTDFHDQARDPSADIAFFGNATYERIVAQNLSGVHVIRNPLSIIVSSYYSHLNSHPMDGWPQLRRQRELLQTVTREHGILLSLTFVERADIADRAIGPLLSLRQWDYNDKRFSTVRAEDLVAQPEATLRPILSGLPQSSLLALPTDSEMSFSHFSCGRQVAEVDNASHYRSGSAKAWKAEAPTSVIRYIRVHFTEFLERFYPEVLVD